MGFIIIIPFAALAGWVIFAMFRWLRRGSFGPKWWRAFGLLACAGLALGVWFAFFLRYQVANARLAGFPIPVQISNQEKPGAPWTGSELPAAIRYAGLLTNVLSGVAIAMVPIAVAAFFKENRMTRDQFGRPQLPRA